MKQILLLIIIATALIFPQSAPKYAVINSTANENLMTILGGTPGYYVNINTGALAVNAGYTATPYIPVTGNTIYSTNNARPYAWYTSGKVFISGASASLVFGSNQSFVSPSNAAYIRFSYPNSATTPVMLVAGVSVNDIPYTKGNKIQTDANSVPWYASQIDKGYTNAILGQRKIASPSKYYFLDSVQNNIYFDALTFSNDTYPFIPTYGYNFEGFYRWYPAASDIGTNSTKVYLYDKTFSPIDSVSISIYVSNIRDSSASVVCNSFGDSYTAGGPYQNIIKRTIGGVKFVGRRNNTTDTSVYNDAYGGAKLDNYYKDYIGVNIIPSTGWTDGYYVNNGDGSLVANSGYAVTDYIAVTANNYYIMNYQRFGAWYNSSRVFISGFSNTDTYGALQAPAGAAYVRVSLPYSRWTKSKGFSVYMWDNSTPRFSPILHPKEPYRYYGSTGFWKNVYSDSSNYYYTGYQKTRLRIGFSSTTGFKTSPSFNDVMWASDSIKFMKWNGSAWTTLVYDSLIPSIRYGRYAGLYLTSTPTIVTCMLGINDMFSKTPANFDDSFIRYKTFLQEFIDSVHAYSATLPFAILTPPVATYNQDGFGYNNTQDQMYWRYKNIMWQLSNALYFNFDSRTSEKIYVVNTGAALDRVYNTAVTSVIPNSKYTGALRVNRQTDTVHPTQDGYDQLGECLAGFIQWMRNN